jgi:hypothetical protein
MVESEGSVMKRSSLGAKPNMPLNISMQAIVKLNSHRFQFKRKSAANALLSQPVLIEGTKQSESLLQDIFKNLISFAANLVKQEYTQSSEYFIFWASAQMIYVRVLLLRRRLVLLLRRQLVLLLRCRLVLLLRRRLVSER